MNTRVLSLFGGVGILVMIGLVVCVSCPFLSIGLYEAYQNFQMLNTFVSTRGTVVANDYRAFVSGGASYVAIVEFQTKEGKRVRFTDGIGTFPPEFQVGSQVDVLYDPNDTAKARINSWTRLWLAPTIFITVGTLPVLIGAAVIIVVSGVGWRIARRSGQ